jgi:hypothetical protein
MIECGRQYTYKEGDRGDNNVDKSLSNSSVDDQLEELRKENTVKN